jgi:SAM-dependent methyltransferase
LSEQAKVSAIRHDSLMVEENSVTHSAGVVGGDASRPWQTLSSGFEQARAREDSLDRLVEWPAERALLGDVTGLAVLDAGCGNGAKVAQLADDGAAGSVGVDISGNFIVPPPGVELFEGISPIWRRYRGSQAGGSTGSCSCNRSGTRRTGSRH